MRLGPCGAPAHFLPLTRVIVPLFVRGKIARDPVMMDTDYVVMTVKCPRCKTKQKVHVAVSTRNNTKIGQQTILCIQCDNSFKVTLPDKIIRGPLPALVGDSLR